jgi:DNA-binding transcriptional LysR family regulator
MIAFDRYLPESNELRVELVCKERIFVAINKDHPLAAQDGIRVEMLRDESLIDERDSSLFTATQKLFMHHGFAPRTRQKAADMIAAAIMVAGGFGTALVPESVRTLNLPGVVYRPLVADVDCTVDLHCAYRRDESSPLLTALLEEIRAFRQCHTTCIQNESLWRCAPECHTEKA